MKTRKLLSLFSATIILFAACEKQKLDELKTESTTELRLKSTYSLNSWMGSLDDNLSLSEISIPGTHNSGSLYESISGTAKCQDLTIAEQLEIGVRYLDIRCRHYEDAFVIHHGSIYQQLNFNDVLNACFNFLNENPTETILMHIKEEYDPYNNTRTFEETFDAYVQQNSSGWYLNSSLPALANARGKIVLFRRFSASSTPKGINVNSWSDNTTFTCYTGTVTCRIQDYYSVPSISSKWSAINSLLSEAVNGSNSTMYINYCSGYTTILWFIPSITTVSDYVNPKITDYFTTNTSGRYGVLPMDFVEEGCSSLIIETNF
jgi:1-phosphatidylinositol phosphodiesterase